MGFNSFRMLLGAALLTAMHAVGLLAAENAGWDYSGELDPQNWGRLSKAYAPCDEGTDQSPVDLTGAIQAELGGVERLWESVEWSIRNTGHAIQLEAPDAGAVAVENESYSFEKIVFHTPSEHTIEGKRFAMEAQFIYTLPDGDTAIVAVMMEPGGQNDLFASIMKAAPKKKGEALLGKADPEILIPQDSAVLRYRGSLTTPPCSETVVWSVMEQPLQVRRQDIEAFRKLYSVNARPLQDLNRRYVLRQ